MMYCCSNLFELRLLYNNSRIKVMNNPKYFNVFVKVMYPVLLTLNMLASTQSQYLVKDDFNP